MITVGNDNTMKTEKVEELRCSVHQHDGNKFEVKLENVKEVPDVCTKLFCITKVLTPWISDRE